jgi:hypothetical protein
LIKLSSFWKALGAEMVAIRRKAGSHLHRNRVAAGAAAAACFFFSVLVLSLFEPNYESHLVALFGTDLSRDGILPSSSKVPASINVGTEYSDAACWLEPAWGMISHSENEACASGTNSSSSSFYSNATQLTCADKPTITTRSHLGLTIALLYYAEPAMLLLQLENFASYPNEVRQQLTILIVDDGSPEGLRATEYLGDYDSFFRLRIARIITDKDWNIGGARNLAFFLADTQRALLLDLDTVVPLETMKAALSWKTQDYRGLVMAHRFNRNDGKTIALHPAVTLMDVEAYWGSGGCDEDFVGSYGYTDIHFWHRWDKDARRVQQHHRDVYILEVEHTACNSTLIKSHGKKQKCRDVHESLQKPHKGSTTNRRRRDRKVKSECWSNRYLRFRWMLER